MRRQGWRGRLPRDRKVRRAPRPGRVKPGVPSSIVFYNEWTGLANSRSRGTRPCAPASLSKLGGERGDGRGFAPCCHENNCAKGILECGRSSYRLGMRLRQRAQGNTEVPTMTGLSRTQIKSMKRRQLRGRTPRRFAHFRRQWRAAGAWASVRKGGSLSAPQAAEPPVST